MEDVEMGSHRLMTAIETYVQCEPRYITVCAYVSDTLSVASRNIIHSRLTPTERKDATRWYACDVCV